MGVLTVKVSKTTINTLNGIEWHVTGKVAEIVAT